MTTRQQRRANERQRRKEEEQRKRADELANRKLRAFRAATGNGDDDSAAEGQASVRDPGQAAVTEAIDTEYEMMMGYECPGCRKMKGEHGDEAVAAGFNRATFLMKCLDCGSVLQMRPKKKKLGADRKMQARAQQIAAAKLTVARTPILGPDGRPVR